MLEYRCQRCGETFSADCKVCPHCLVPIPAYPSHEDTSGIWPPAPSGRRVIRLVRAADESSDDELAFSRKFIILSIFAPTMFFPFALYYGIVAMRNGKVTEGRDCALIAGGILLLYIVLYVVILKP